MWREDARGKHTVGGFALSGAVGGTEYIRADVVADLCLHFSAALDDLEAYTKAEWGWPDVHPANRVKFERDMAEIAEGRALLARMGEGEHGEA